VDVADVNVWMFSKVPLHLLQEKEMEDEVKKNE
jgi:hypothetical protein